MTYASAFESSPDAVYQPAPELMFSPRSRHQWIPLLIPLVLCGMSWIMGGVPMVTDMGFVLLACICALYVIGEFMNFPRRFGLGGLLLYGGVLIWFCHDYISHWLGYNFDAYPFPYSAATIAKAAAFHTLFIVCMSIGLGMKGGQRLQRIILCVPEPASETAYFVLILLCAMVGFSPFLLFTRESLPVSLFHGAFSTWSGPVLWTVGRTGNLNYSWGAYVAQVLDVGEVGGIFASIFAILISTRLVTKIVAWGIWLFWVFFVFNGARRGDLAFMALPALFTYFIKYQSRVAMAFRRQSLTPYILCGTVGLVLLVVIQIEGTFRAIGLDKVDFGRLEITKNQGNSMFSEGLLAWKTVPEQHDFFRNNFPGAGFIRPLPDALFWFVISPIPRVLWHDKPVDDLWAWYNQVVTGDPNGREGTTISKGLVGSFYFNYGVWGVIEGGLLIGWLMALCERCLQNSNGRPMGILMSLGMGVWLFRVYRDFEFIELYSFIVGAVTLAGFVYFCRIFTGSAPTGNQLMAPQPAAGY